jgi:TRAP transporter 4TM/12TM fusion protein
MGLVFLLYPARRGLTDRRGIPWYDVLLSAAAIATNFYIVANYTHLISNEIQILGYTTEDNVVAVVGIVLILEATRRCVGLPIVIIASGAILYGVFGQYAPIFSHAGYTWDSYATETFFTSRSVFGTPIQVSSTFIFLFLLFSVVLIRTNIGAFFNDMAFRATGRFTGGPAKASVVASAMQGMVSGSSVANTVASGSFTIPIMKRAGFRPSFAGATEASASSGGQLVPPVMGAAAFIMAEYTGVPYAEIIILAIFPAILKFIGIFVSIHFEARRDRILGVHKSELPAWGGLARRVDLFLPLVIIVGLLLSGRSPANAALWGIVAAFVLSFLRRDTRLTPLGILQLLEDGARVALPVIAACATAGIVAGTVTATGLGGKLAGGILDLAFGQFSLVLLFTMVACLILGMGLPTTANYVVTATIAAPILLNLFDVPIIAAHMFVFYFGILADVTPPVCLAAYAASGIARSNPMRTGVTALRVSIGGFIVPFVFVLEPSILLVDATVGAVVPVLVTVILGMVAIGAGLAGHLVRDASAVERVLLVAAGVALVYPNSLVSVPGLALLLAIGAVQWLRERSSSRP